MAALVSSDPLALDLPFMDQARRHFMHLLDAVEAASDSELPEAWRTLAARAAEDFGREDLWMHSTAFCSRKPHTVQHLVVLEVMREGIQHGEAGRLAQLRQMARQFRDWYHKHVQTMDAALALHLRGARFEPANGESEGEGEGKGKSGRGGGLVLVPG